MNREAGEAAPGAGSPKAPDAAARLRGFGPLGWAAIVVILAGSVAGPIVAALLVLAWTQVSETPLRALGFTAPRSWPTTVVVGVAFGVVFKLVTKAVVMPLLGAPAVNAPYHYLAGNPAALPGVVATILVSAAFCEEVFFRGYFFERLGKLLGDGTAARVAIVLISTALFALAHFPDQRLPGVELALMTGSVMGGIFAWRRQLWLLMVVHAAFDLTAVALIYWSWEDSVAHLFFR